MVSATVLQRWLLACLVCVLPARGDRPGKPENLSCVALQEKTYISSTISCSWEPVGRQTTDVPTTYKLHLVTSNETHNVSTRKNTAQLSPDIFPNHMTLEFWVEASNELGKIESEHLKDDAGCFVKTNPPSDVTVTSEKSFPTSLLMNWTHPIAREFLKLTYQIRFCPDGSQSWTYVPLGDTNKYIQSFRLQKLQPDTVYVTQVRCKNVREDCGDWSNWSTNATKRTPEGQSHSHLVITPQSPVVEMGTNFTATCMIIDTTEVTADDLYWNLSRTTVSKELYTKINRSALNVTIPVTSEKPQWLFCLCKERSANVVLNQGKFIHGIYLKKGYRPGKPENLSCVALQEKTYISSTISCSWEPVGRQTTDVPTTYKLHLVTSNEAHNVSTRKNTAQLSPDIFPNHMTLEFWVEASNELGKIESEHLKDDAGCFVKTNPPSDVTVISEKSFPTSLLMNWTHPIVREFLKLTYQIRFCPDGSQSWTYVPLGDTNKYIQSFRLQKLQPDTVYVTQVRCKNVREDCGYWSNWSTNATKRTPEGRPTSKPDLWKVITEGDRINERQVIFISKDPVFANGRIIRFNMKVQDQKDEVKNGSWEWESIPAGSEAYSSSSQQKITVLKKIDLPDTKWVQVYVTASNSVGTSAAASLFIPEKTRELPPVEDLKVWPQGGQLWLEWKPPKSTAVCTEYVVEWVSGDQTDWQRENRSTRKTAMKGNLEKFVCYNVSVYPIYSGWTGRSASKQAFLEQGVPLEGPVVRLKDKPGCNEAELVWNEIPQHSRQGFITNYKISYTSGTELHEVIVPANTTSYTLMSLSRNTKYDTWITVSTIRGSAKGFNHSFTTLKYAQGEIEGIVVGVSLGFLFVVLLTMLLCVYKKDVIKENFWPQIPNPGESTIGNWSPDYPLKAETPKENCLSGISVLDVDVCDGKCVFEEDKASLPLKKDKYLSEEHSSGIGGSSCMSSPRQSVSDSDEGGDMADTTASTVQYSSVVASSGYKGQTPSSQPQQAIFSRSESTQPLLDSEENPDMLLQEGSRQSQRFLRRPCFTHTAGSEDSADRLEMEQQEVLEPLDFCPLEEDSEQTTPTDGQAAEWLPAAPASSYMPQLGGYRPQ